MVVLAMTMAVTQMAAAAASLMGPPSVTPPAPREEDLVLFAVVLDGVTLTETLTAYEATSDPMLPLGELARLLDLDVTVSPAQASATGSLGEESRSLVVNLSAGLARSGGIDVTLSPESVAVSQTDLYLRASAMEQILPLRILVDLEFLQITLVATETLPLQARSERYRRMDAMESGAAGPGVPVLRADTPYRLASPPAADLAFETGHDTRTGLTARRYDVRMAADVLGAGATLYLGSDVEGDLATARVLAERRWSRSDGRTLEIAAGDVFTPLMTIGPRSQSGRGVTIVSGPSGAASAFQRITLRGELPLGYDVELYVNDVLRSGQRVPVEGRYEFLDVPLGPGLNVLRIVTYGPHGERSEDTQILNVGGGQMEGGAFAFELGAVQQRRPVIDPSPDPLARLDPAYGDLRVAATAAYGLRDGITLVGGAATWADAGGARRDMVTVGARGSLAGVALLADAAHDFAGGSALAGGAAAEVAGISATLRHIEYAGEFLDEANSVLDQSRAPARRSEANLNFDLRALLGAGVPLSLRAERTVHRDGGESLAGFARASAVLGETLASGGLDYTRDALPDGETTKLLSGNLAASRYIDFAWRTRAVLDYELVPDTALRAFSVTADRELSEIFGLGLGAGRVFGDNKDFTLQANIWALLPFADLTLGGDYATANGDWRVGLRIALGLIFDPAGRRPRFTRPGPATGGSALFRAFVDTDADGVFDPDEAAAPGVVVSGGERDVLTGADGAAFVTGLGDTAEAMLRVDMNDADAFFVSTPPSDIAVVARPGAVAAIPWPMTPVGEVYVTLFLRRPDGMTVGLSAVRIRLVGAGGETFEATTAFDGTAVIADVRPGTYDVELDPDQARRLGMRLSAPLAVTVASDGFTPDLSAELRFEARD